MDPRKKDEDEDEPSPYENVQKSMVLQEIKCFNDKSLNVTLCCQVLTKILYLQSRGETFSNAETTQIFFSVTRLFQSQDPVLRRMLYLSIKSLNTKQEEVFVVTSSLLQDINGKVDTFRANAIRVLAQVIDTSMLSQVDRFFKQAIVDKNAFTSSSALVAGIHLFKLGPDVIRRWVNEVQEAVSAARSKMSQYHALHLLYLIKRHDRLAITKVVSALARAPPKSALAQCLLVRFVGSALRDAGGNVESVVQASADHRALLEFVQAALRNKNSAVVYEAAREMCRMRGASSQLLTPAVAALQEFLSHPVPTQRFAAVRALAEVVQLHPGLVVTCTSDLEHLISDPNRSIATLAITTLLKTGVESSVERLMKSIAGFMSEISDEFKIVVVDAVRALCLKFPQKYATLMKFLSTVLREEGGLEYKRAIVSTMLSLMAGIEEARELGLDHLCEFIEDCEFPELAVQVLHVLAEEAPRIKNAARFIRHIYNRVILEVEPVRAGAVSALAKIGAAIEPLQSATSVLLKRCMFDNDDEVRDRATLLSAMLSGADGAFARTGASVRGHTSGHDESASASRALVCAPLAGVSLGQLDASLSAYLAAGDFESPFGLDKLVAYKEGASSASSSSSTTTTSSSSMAAAAAAIGESGGAAAGGLLGAAAGVREEVNPFAAALAAIPEIAALGPLFRSSRPVSLTEAEAEFGVSCTKHVFPAHVVLQFDITNTLEGQWIDAVSVELDLGATEWHEEFAIPSACLGTGAAGVAYACLARPDAAFSLPSCAATLKYTLKDAEDDAGFGDEYQLEAIDMQGSDFVRPLASMNLLDFRRAWEGLSGATESVKKYSLSMNDLQQAVDAVIEFVGLAPVEASHRVPDGATTHAVNLVGVFLPECPVYARAGFMLDAKHGVALKIAARCEQDGVAPLITSSIH